MTANHPYVAWLRRLAGLVALAGVLVLSACGGGSGAPNNPFTPTPPAPAALTVFPAGPTIYSQVASTLTITGGVAPYRAFSSNSALLPVPQSLPGNTITLLAGTVNSVTAASITIQDSAGATVTASVTINPGPPSPPPPLTVLPSPIEIYSTVGAQLTVSGGVPPYRAFSSNTAVLPVVQNVSGNIVNLVATTVVTDTNVTIVVQDSVDQRVSVSVLVHPKATTPALPLVVLPASVVTSKGVPVTLTISGGKTPYRAYSSNPAVVPVTQAVADNKIVVIANSVAVDTNVVVTVQDDAGTTATVGVLVQTDPSVPPPTLAVLPSSLIIFSGVATSIAVTGGVPPYTAFSSNPTILPIAPAVSGGAIALLASNVSADTGVTLTVADSAGKTATAGITVRAATLFSAIVVKPNIADCGATAICSGQSGTATVALQLPGGGAASGRQVRFDVVTGPYALAATGSGASVQSVTVTSDAAGNAQAIIRANVDAPTQPALIRATDLTSGQQLTGEFLIQQRTDGSTILTVVPQQSTIQGAFIGECSIGFRIDYYIYGGTPPYRITQNFPTASVILTPTVNASGGFFEVVTNGTCVNPQVFSILDATGRQTTAQLFNLEGTVAEPVVPPSDLVVVPGALTAACTGSETFTYVVTGGTAPYNVFATPTTAAGPTLSTQVVNSNGGSVRVTNVTQSVTLGFVDSSKPKKTQTLQISCTGSGTPAALKVSPLFRDYTVPAGNTCVGKTPTFTISGGTPPYTAVFVAPNGPGTPTVAGSSLTVTGLEDTSTSGVPQTFVRITDSASAMATTTAEIDCP